MAHWTGKVRASLRRVNCELCLKYDSDLVNN